ncbi:SsgA family sporulation/cell division regulator [Streptomyces sp. NPDC052042]|uniref:SsgA family sporulation/cell division regulator n=1 Tax=Streptomyces sp. NPDC052042 TaxID=3365683 RepID=UPI0037D2E4EE
MAYHLDTSLDMELVLAPHERVAVPARLCYGSDDPYAVTFAFHTGSEEPVTWTFARDLLADSVLRPTGDGDIRLWPSGTGHHMVLNLALSSPAGRARLAAPLRAVTDWLTHTYRLVPAGRETDGLDVDAALSRLLHGTG